MQIFIKSIEGETLTLNVKDSMTVAMVKQLIADKVVEERCKSRLIYGGTQLDDSMRLSDYNIVKGSTIFEEGRLRGGMGKRAAPAIPDEQKIDRLIKRAQGDFRPVPTSEITKLTSAFNSRDDFLHEMTDPSSIETKLMTMPMKDLEALADLLSDRVQGSASSAQLVTVAKSLYPQISAVEQGLLTTKAVYGEMMAAFMGNYAKAFHSFTVEDAIFDNKAFRKVLQDCVSRRRAEDINNKKFFLEQKFNEEVMKRAR